MKMRHANRNIECTWAVVAIVDGERDIEFFESKQDAEKGAEEVHPIGMNGRAAQVYLVEVHKVGESPSGAV